MTMLFSLMLTLTVAMTTIMVLRICGTWLQVNESAEDGDLERLQALQGQENGWVIRHLVCAILAFSLVAAAKYFPSLGAPENLVDVTAVYSLVSFIFAFAESVLAQRIAVITLSQMQPLQERQEEELS